MWIVVSCFQRWINRMALSFLGSANLVRPGLRANGPSNTAYPSPYGEQNARPCIHRKSQRRHIHIHMERKNEQAWKDHFYGRKKRGHSTFIELVGSASETFML